MTIKVLSSCTSQKAVVHPRRRVLDAARSATAPAVVHRFGVSVTTVHRLRRLD